MKQIETEMLYTTYGESCKDLHVTPEGDLRECRRTRGHWTEGTECASGFGRGLVRWVHTKNRFVLNPDGFMA